VQEDVLSSLHNKVTEVVIFMKSNRIIMFVK